MFIVLGVLGCPKQLTHGWRVSKFVPLSFWIHCFRFSSATTREDITTVSVLCQSCCFSQCILLPDWLFLSCLEFVWTQLLHYIYFGFVHIFFQWRKIIWFKTNFLFVNTSKKIVQSALHADINPTWMPRHCITIMCVA